MVQWKRKNNCNNNLWSSNTYR